MSSSEVVITLIYWWPTISIQAKGCDSPAPRYYQEMGIRRDEAELDGNAGRKPTREEPSLLFFMPIEHDPRPPPLHWNILL